MRGQLWQECENRNCTTEPVCSSCFRCERHCGCAPPPSEAQLVQERDTEMARRAAAASSKAAFMERLAGEDWEPTECEIEERWSSGRWEEVEDPARRGRLLDAALQREPWYAPRVKREPITNRRDLIRHLATVRDLHVGDEWYETIRLRIPL